MAPRKNWHELKVCQRIYLHGAGNAFAIAEDLVQILRTQDVTQRRLS